MHICTPKIPTYPHMVVHDLEIFYSCPSIKLLQIHQSSFSFYHDIDPKLSLSFSAYLHFFFCHFFFFYSHFLKPLIQFVASLILCQALFLLSCNRETQAPNGFVHFICFFMRNGLLQVGGKPSGQ